MSTRSRIRAVGRRSQIVLKDGAYSLFTLPRDAIYVVGLALLAGLLSLGAVFFVAVTVVILQLLSMLLFFSSTLQTVIDVLMLIVAGIGLGIVPLAVAQFAVVDLFSPPDGLLSPDPSGWEYPVVLPLTGFALLVGAAWLAAPPWPGLFERVVAGLVAALVLYRGALYPVVLDAGSDTWYGYDTAQRRVHDAVPDGTVAGRAAFGVGVGWLAAALTVTVVSVLVETIAVALLETMAVLPLLPPSRPVTLGVPVSIALGLTLLYTGRSAAVVIVGRRYAIRGWLGTIGTWIRHRLRRLSAISRTAATTVRTWFEYAVLLRPR